MSPERKRLLAKILVLHGNGYSTRQIAEKLGVTVGVVAGILRDSSDAKRAANRRRPRDEAA